MTSDIDLSGQIALVTGASRGIGRGIAIALAKAGMSVAVTARTEGDLAETARLIEGAGGTSVAYPADITDLTSLEQLVADTEQQLGSIDLLVNNAGLPGTPGPDWLNDHNEWWRVMETNIRGPFLMARAVVPRMIERRQGRIVNVSSSSAYLSSPNMSSYTASKAALTNWSRSLAEATQEYGISVFAYCPGLVLTEMTEMMRDSPIISEADRQRMSDALDDRALLRPYPAKASSTSRRDRPMCYQATTWTCGGISPRWSGASRPRTTPTCTRCNCWGGCLSPPRRP